MWQKRETDPPQPEPAAPPPPPRPSPPPDATRRERATIGASIVIKGELTGDEDLVVQGQVEGKIDLRQHNVTIGRSGRVKADVFGNVISVEGEVEGNLFGTEQIVIRQSGKVHGNLSSPRVSLEDGAKFKGSIDMEPRSGRPPAAGGERPASAGPAAPPPGVAVSKVEAGGPSRP